MNQQERIKALEELVRSKWPSCPDCGTTSEFHYTLGPDLDEAGMAACPDHGLLGHAMSYELVA